MIGFRGETVLPKKQNNHPTKQRLICSNRTQIPSSIISCMRSYHTEVNSKRLISYMKAFSTYRKHLPLSENISVGSCKVEIMMSLIPPKRKQKWFGLCLNRHHKVILLDLFWKPIWCSAPCLTPNKTPISCAAFERLDSIGVYIPYMYTVSSLFGNYLVSQCLATTPRNIHNSCLWIAVFVCVW